MKRIEGKYTLLASVVLVSYGDNNLQQSLWLNTNSFSYSPEVRSPNECWELKPRSQQGWFLLCSAKNVFLSLPAAGGYGIPLLLAAAAVAAGYICPICASLVTLASPLLIFLLSSVFNFNTKFKGYTPFAVNTKCWLYSPYCTAYPCDLSYTQ